MSQFNLFTSKEEEIIISRFREKWELSKQETLKKMIRDFTEKKK